MSISTKMKHNSSLFSKKKIYFKTICFKCHKIHRGPLRMYYLTSGRKGLKLTHAYLTAHCRRCKKGLSQDNI